MAKKPRRNSSGLASFNLRQALEQIVQLGQAGKLAEAATQCQQLLKQHPNHAQAWHLLSLICLQQEQPQQAIQHIQRAIDLAPDVAEFYSQAGTVYCRLEDLEAGIECYRRALSLQPHLDHVQFNLGLALQKSGQFAAAIQTYETLLNDKPYAAAYQQLGNIYQQLEQFSTAISAYRMALKYQPSVAAWCNLGVALQALGEIEQAQTAFQQALALNPKSVEAHNGLGAIYEKQERATEAIQHYQAALAIQADYIPALLNLGNIHSRLEHFSEAETFYRHILRLQPNHIQAIDELIKCALTICDWEKLPELIRTLQESVRDAINPGVSIDVSPLNSLYLPFTAAEQQAIAQAHAAGIERRMAEARQLRGQRGLVEKTAAKTEGKIRLGYVSGDFRYHAVGQLILALFEQHDREQFEVFAYSLSPDDGSFERQKLIQDCDRFREVRHKTPAEIAEQIEHDQIDILIDLAGYTNFACPEVFALRPAPLQINYLGYPATLGASYIDYIVTDAVITPPELATTLSEHCLYLPETYQINCYPYPEAANQKREAEGEPPANGFVFCCFNKSQKIEPVIFVVWMRILTQVPNSVLWLLSDRPETEQNLRRQAAEQGVDPARLIFAPRVAKADHLKRHQHASLFLDTLYYNAHVTASDALWAGTPLITVMGNTFASRVAASLLNAAGVPELVAADLDAYERLAVHLATDPAELQRLKSYLLEHRSQAALFDIARTVHHLEVGYQLIWQRHQANLAPETVSVQPSVTRSNAAINPARTVKSTAQKKIQNSQPHAKTSEKVNADLNAQETSEDRITCTADAGFLNWLSNANGALLITTYQAGKVLLVGWNGQQVTLLARQFEKPMGMAVAGQRLALTTKHELIFFANADSLAHSYLSDQPGRYDALYLPRATYWTGDLHTHDLAFGQDGLWLVNTRFSCLASLSLDFNFLPRWYPPFISEIVPEDRCHLNGLAMVAGRPKYVTALGESDAVGGWRATKATGGIVIDVETDEIVLRGLSMPHSPRWYRDQLWLLNSGAGELWCVDPKTWQPEVVCALPGFGRGLTLLGDYALIGLCQNRETHIFGELPVQQRFEQLTCGVAVIDLRTGNWVGRLEFSTGCRELYDLKFLPGLLRPNLLNSSKDATRDAFTAPEFAYWLRPSNVVGSEPAG